MERSLTLGVSSQGCFVEIHKEEWLFDLIRFNALLCCAYLFRSPGHGGSTGTRGDEQNGS